MNVTQHQLTKWIVINAIILSVLVAALLALGFYAWSQTDEATRANAKTNHRQDASDRRLREAVARLRVLTNPTPAEYRAQLRRGIRLCLREPSCRRLFPRLARAAHARRREARSLRSNPRSGSRPGSVVRSPERSKAPHRRQSPGRARRPPPAAGPSASPPPSAPPSRPEPLLGVQTPLVPASVCSDQLRINC